MEGIGGEAVTVRERLITAKLAIVADDEECGRECPALEARGRTRARTCAVFSPAKTLEERYSDYGGISFLRHQRCTAGEVKP